MSDPIALARAAATPPQPVPLRADAVPAPATSGSLHVRGRSPTREGSVVSRGASPEVGSVRGASPPPVVLGSSPPVPYQALPVRGPVITHNMTAGLPVLDPGAELSEVRRREGGGLRGSADGGTPPNPLPRGRRLAPVAPRADGGWAAGCGRHQLEGRRQRKGGVVGRGQQASCLATERETAPRRPKPFPPPPPPFPQEFEARVHQVIEDYKAKLVERTEHHMG